jgi:hypothetical protein
LLYFNRKAFPGENETRSERVPAVVEGL